MNLTAISSTTTFTMTNELTTIKAYVPINRYMHKFDLKKGDTIVANNQHDYRYVFEQVLNVKQILAIHPNTNAYIILPIDVEHSVEVEMVRLADLSNIKYIKQQEIPFADEKSI